jgi:hypothetical protein
MPHGMIDPNITVRFDNDRQEHRGGDEVRGTVRITPPPGQEAGAAEISLLWTTEGKGNTDEGIAWFESFAEPPDPRAERELAFSTRLPLLPQSYDGILLKITWVVRVRILRTFGNDIVFDIPFVVR